MRFNLRTIFVVMFVAACLSAWYASRSVIVSGEVAQLVTPMGEEYRLGLDAEFYCEVVRRLGEAADDCLEVGDPVGDLDHTFSA